MPCVRKRRFGEVLVPGEHRSEHAGTGVGDLEELEQLLDHAVLAELAVQRDVDRVGPLGAQRVDELGDEVEREHAVAARLERRDDARAGLQRDLALERAPAHENRDLVRHALFLSRHRRRLAAPSIANSLPERALIAHVRARPRRGASASDYH